MSWKLGRVAVMLAAFALAATLPATCLCTPAPQARASGHDCCAPPLGVSAAGHGCCDATSAAAVPSASAPPVAPPAVAALVSASMLSPGTQRPPVCAPSPPPRVLRI
ncbi:MAG: hypothetical protein ACM3PV_07205 [Betaproteobacteria bacterium]